MKKERSFNSKAAQPGRKADSCLKTQPLQKTQRKTLPLPAGPVPGCCQSSFSHSKLPLGTAGDPESSSKQLSFSHGRHRQAQAPSFLVPPLDTWLPGPAGSADSQPTCLPDGL